MTLSLVRDDHPGCTHVGTFPPGSEDWLLMRRERLGGSEIGAILGLHEYSSYFKVYMQKAGVLTDDDENPQMEWGNRLEPAVLQKFTESFYLRLGDEVGGWMVRTTPGSFVRADRDWQLATPDGIISLDGMWYGLIEAKTAHDATGWGKPGTNEIPPGYRAQVLWNLNVLGLTRAWVPVLIGGSDYREYYLDTETDPDAAEDLALLLERGEQFIDRLRNGVWPELGDGSEVTYQAVRKIHPEIEDVEVEIQPELAGEYLAAEQELDEATKRFTAARSLVMHAMGTAKHAVQASDQWRQRFAYRTARTTKDGEPGIPFLQTDRKTKTRLTIKEAGQKA